MRNRGRSAQPGAPPREPVERFLASLVERRLFSSVVGLVGSAGRILWTSAAGLARAVPPVPATEATRFDLASLTKPFIASLALRLDALGRLPLELPVGEVWPQAHPTLARRTLEDLLRHRSGLIAWTPLYARCRSRRDALDLLLSGGLLGARAGTYSDLGYILWGLAAEERLGEGLEPLLRRHVFEPLGIETVEASPGDAPDVAECRIDSAREVELAADQGLGIPLLPAPRAGNVQDGNARFLGGLAAHAGLFGRAEDLWRLGTEWLRPGQLLGRRKGPAALSGSGAYALGWARRRVRGGSAGRVLSAASVGHTGFTGGSLWIDPERDRILVLLGHRTSAASELNPVRRRFHRLSMQL